MKDIECKEVIISTLERRGQGICGDPLRRITQVYDKNGDLIAEHDSQTFTAEQMLSFAKWAKQNLETDDLVSADIHNWKNPHHQNKVI